MDEMTLFKKLSEAQKAQGYQIALTMDEECWQCSLVSTSDPLREPPSGSGISILTALNDAVSMKRKREANDAEAASKRHAG